MIFQFFSNSMIFPCMELFFVIFQVFKVPSARGNPDPLIHASHSCSFFVLLITYYFHKKSYFQQTLSQNYNRGMPGYNAWTLLLEIL